MLRRYGRHFHRAWLFSDVAVTTLIFVALTFHESFAIEGGLNELGTLPVVVLGFATAIGWQIIVGRFGVYQSHRRGELQQFVQRVACADVVGASALAAVIFTLGIPAAPLYPIAVAGMIFLSQVSVRVPVFILLRGLRRSGRNTRNILVAGTGPRAEEVVGTVAKHPEWGLRIIGFLDDGQSSFAPMVPQAKVHKYIDLPRLVREETIDEVLVACPLAMLAGLGPVVHECATAGIPVTLLTDLFGEELPMPRVGNFDSVGTLSFAPVHHNDLELAVKRGIDIVGALTGLVLTAPIVVAAALAIRINSRGPIFFRQIRCGLNGRRFEMIKLRTMHVDADRRKAELMHLNEMDGPVFKLSNDPRVTGVGKLLRRLSIDELPQFWNVLMGEMSLVGPRPPTPEEVGMYVGNTRRRLSMRPGLTCYWQISGRSNLTFVEWIKLDLHYIDTFSLLNDMMILLRTIPEVIMTRGAR